MIMENKFREKLEPKIREKSIRLRTFTFTKLYFGQKVGDVSGGAACICCAVSSLSQTLPHVTRLTEDISGDLAGGPASLPQWRPRTPESQHRHLCRFRGSLAQREQKGKVGNESTFLQPSFENVPCSGSQPDAKMSKLCLLRHQRGAAHLRVGDRAAEQGTVLHQFCQ